MTPSQNWILRSEHELSTSKHRLSTSKHRLSTSKVWNFPILGGSSQISPIS